MEALVFAGYGGPEQMKIADVATPEPGAGELRVRVRAAGLNPVDARVRSGAMKAFRKLEFPAVAGYEFAGEVESIGAGVTGFAVGDRVVARVEHERMAALAEFALVDAGLAARIPDGVDFVTAAAVPLAGLTALQVLRDELRVGPGTRLYIAGGAGGVGTLAIQLAKHLGAEVTTSASPRGAELVRSLGADAVIDYTAPEAADSPRDFDAALDAVGGDDTLRTLARIRRGGALVSITGAVEPLTAKIDLGLGRVYQWMFAMVSRDIRKAAKSAGVSYRYLFMHPDGAELAELMTLVGEGTMRPVVDREFPFDEVLAAFAYLEAGHAKGKVVVTL